MSTQRGVMEGGHVALAIREQREMIGGGHVPCAQSHPRDSHRGGSISMQIPKVIMKITTWFGFN